jgi:coniferyl-aldehyde dehydrogenase
MVNDRQAQRIDSLIADASAKGATVTSCAPRAGVNRIPLQVVAGVTDDMRVAQEEVFGSIIDSISATVILKTSWPKGES